jgi:FkbM family methyltransferase
VKLLFLMRHSGYVRNFESTLRLLCERGHAVHLAFQGKVKYAQLDPTDIAPQLARTYPAFTHGTMPVRTDGWGRLGRELRLGLDYLRYLEPEYDHAPKLRERAAREAPAWLLARHERGRLRSAAARRATAVWLRAMNGAMPRDPAIENYLRDQGPDVLAVTPLIEPGAPQSEYLRSARELGIRTACCVASWDNLTNKGLIHGPVDLVAVWNDAMKREAETMHGMSPSRVVVTGAAAFDHWFDWRPSRTREDFCARVGLPAGRPYVLYLCSSKFVAPDEAAFVQTWLARLRERTGALRDAGVLVRPHPQNAEHWEGVDLQRFAPVARWPENVTAPVDAQTRNAYYDSIYYSAAVVGINTTAEIESAILGRPVYTVLAPEYRDTQLGTLHFAHLRESGGGLLHTAADLTGHVEQLDAAVRQPAGDGERSRRFVAAFVRPFGLHEPATPRLVQALEALAAQPADPPAVEPAWAPAARRRLARRAGDLESQHATARAASAARQALKTEREARRRARDEERRARLAEKVQRELEQRARSAAGGQQDRKRSVESLVVDFGRLDERRRRDFLRAVVPSIPDEAFIDLHAATPPRRLDYDRAEIYLRVATKSESFRLRACAKEPFTVEWIESHVKGGDVFYDIGANVGVYSLLAAKKPGGAARVFSFEAGYASVASLCANVVLNRLEADVTPMPLALSDRTAMNVFSVRDVEPGAARHALGAGDPEDGPAVFRQPVMMFRLDDLVEWLRLPPPTHIKLDVDGGELAVLEGAACTLRSPSLRSVLVEVSTALSAAVTKELERHGKRLQSKVSVKNKAGDYAVWYGVFG